MNDNKSWRREWAPGYYDTSNTVTYMTNGAYCVCRMPFGERNGNVYCVSLGGKPDFDNNGWMKHTVRDPDTLTSLTFKTQKAAMSWCDNQP